jgi:predicted AlkP superfamily pyrophosphatase or phosphodiesterase
VLRRVAVVVAVAVSVSALALISVEDLTGSDAPSFHDQICGLDEGWLELIRRGYVEERAGQISVLPRTPAYMAGGGKGWSHSGPWDYLQRVPLVFYGPGRIPARGDVTRPATTADIAPTIAALLKGVVPGDGRVLPEVARFGGSLLRGSLPPVIVTVVLDGAGWNVLDRWPESWPVLAGMMGDGVSYTNARVGSSPSVTPSIHTTLGTGRFPAAHGISSVEMRDDNGDVVDAFFDGESARFIKVPTIAELWDEQNDNRALVGMIGHVPWHLGMIGKGAESPGGDRDHAAWLDLESNRWITDQEHYELPTVFEDQSDLPARLNRLDASDGSEDGLWRDVPLDDESRLEEVPAFTEHHSEKLIEMISAEGYGDDAITDLLFTNFKQIDLLGHYFNMASVQVRDAVAAGDAALGALVDHLDDTVGSGGYVIVVTADHGQQPDEGAVDGYGIDPNELSADLVAEFGPIVQDVAPTEVFLDEDLLARSDISIEEVARFLGNYRLRDNADGFFEQTFGSGRFSAGDRLLDLAVPATMLSRVSC